MSGGRRRPSGLKAHERRFAQVRMPDGREVKVPAAKDAATLICLETSEGGWPQRADTVLLYDVTHLVEGSVFTLKEMRPGRGMGTRRTFRVVESRVEIEQHEGVYGQVQRWLLCAEVLTPDAANELTPADLEAE